MKTILFVFVIAFGVTSCKTTGTLPGPTTSAPVQIAVDCGAPAVRDLATHLLDDVASALLVSGDWHAALAAVAARAGADGWAAVKCAVGECLARADLQLSARAEMAADAADATQLRHDRALQWLSEHP